MKPLFPVFFLLLTSCGCKGDDVKIIYSPDRKYKAVLQQAEGSPGSCFTAVDVMRADASLIDAESDRIAGFEAPHDYKQLKIRWTSNDTLQASYPGFAPGEFPHMSYNSGDQIKFDFPKPLSSDANAVRHTQ
ncbi:hypothetical protein [Lysobacter sp. CA199]|uniref:hypothetical protein n=1 Tax=Lysobacter sp. CA199 TaxID=3455608 RepID=UPI003F8D8489